MEEKIFAIYDNKVEACITIFTARSTSEGTRIFYDQVNKRNPQTGEYVMSFALHPEDYSLFELAAWKPDEMRIEMHEAPKGLGLAVEYVEKD